MLIKRATLVDLPQCVEVGKRYYEDILNRNDFYFAYSLSRWIDLFRKNTGAVFYVENKGKVVGLICGFFYPNIDTGKNMATVAHWCVDKQARGYGIRLLWAFKRWAKKKQCTSLILTCSPETWDEKHKALYTRLGGKYFGQKYIMENL